MPADVRVSAYEALLSKYFPKERVVLSTFPFAMRYAGPREALFTRSRGKTTGFRTSSSGAITPASASYYGTYDAQRDLRRARSGRSRDHDPSVRAQLLLLARAASVASIKTCPHDEAQRLRPVAARRVRELLAKGEGLPAEFTRPEIAEILADGLPRASQEERLRTCRRRTRAPSSGSRACRAPGRRPSPTRSSRSSARRGKKVEVLDGDVVRTHLSKGLGFSREDRDTNIARIAFVAHLLARNGVIVARRGDLAVSSARATRARERRSATSSRSTSRRRSRVHRRDVKGLYKKAIAGEIAQFTGISDPYEAPLAPEVTHRHEHGRLERRAAHHGRSRAGYLDDARRSDADARPIRKRRDAMASASSAVLRPARHRRVRRRSSRRSSAASSRPSSSARSASLRGVYGQRQDGDADAPREDPVRASSAASSSSRSPTWPTRYSRGFGHVTTRQNVQFHFVKMTDAEAAMRRLDEAGLTTREACGNSVRTVTACERRRGVRRRAVRRDAVRRGDHAPLPAASARRELAAQVQDRVQRLRARLREGGDPRPRVHRAVRDGEPGFQVVAAGGLSSVAAERARRSTSSCPAGRDRPRRRGDRAPLPRARKPREPASRAPQVRARKLGEPEFRARYAALSRRGRREAAGELAFAGAPKHASQRRPSSTDDAPATGYLAWRASAVVDQKQQGLRAVLRSPPARRHHARRRCARSPASRTRFGDGTLRLTIDQNVLLPWVDMRSLPALFIELSKLDLARLDIHTARDVTSCPGADTCNLAVTASRSGRREHRRAARRARRARSLRPSRRPRSRSAAARTRAASTTSPTSASTAAPRRSTPKVERYRSTSCTSAAASTSAARASVGRS